jgi:S-DNA-T family DNA segregation ATPase FtsK/SpoIIIE
MIQTLGVFGTVLSLIIVLILIMIFASSKTIPFVRNLLSSSLKFNKLKPAKVSTSAKRSKDSDSINIAEKKEIYAPKPIEKVKIKPVAEVYEDYDDEEAGRLVKKLGVYDPTADLPKYKYPAVDLLKEYDQTDAHADLAEQKENKNRIIKALGKFGIKIQSIEATVGPTVTLYEIVPDDGVRVSKIKNLEDDIAMSLQALGIRIMAPMPGKGTVGIEVPNKEPQIVSMHSIISSPKFQESNLALPIAFGSTIMNEVFMVDLAKLPHLLVAGATGQGKSVGLNAAITSLLYKKHPAELKFVLIDPKMVEFTIYSTIEKHFLAKLPDAEKPIVTDFSKVIYTLNSLTKEMDERYELLEKAGSRNLKEYNEKFVNRHLNEQNGHKFLPYIVVIIDEFGDLILTAGKEIEQPIARIAQKARAVGIHMIIATQRPTVNIITGTIKANFPARVAFRVISSVDSKTILDGQGANQLIGRGDMLFFQGSDMTRVQCAFVDTPEVERISKFIGNQPSYPTAYLLPEYVGEESGSR